MANVKLKYTATDGRWIPMIPNRDLTDYDLEVIVERTSQTHQEIIDELVNAKNPIYKLDESYTCASCGKLCKTHKALIKHEMSHISKSNKGEIDNGQSTDSTQENSTDK